MLKLLIGPIILAIIKVVGKKYKFTMFAIKALLLLKGFVGKKKLKIR